MIQPAKRLDSVQEYYFATKLREVRGLINNGKPVINAGIGSPDLLPPPNVVPA
ncbi:MAG: aminotransferase, partial [Nonlabens ulvanivorans]